MPQLIEMKGERGDAELNFYNVMSSPALLYGCQSRVTTQKDKSETQVAKVNSFFFLSFLFFSEWRFVINRTHAAKWTSEIKYRYADEKFLQHVQ
jgi:hypothetical protein